MVYRHIQHPGEVSEGEMEEMWEWMREGILEALEEGKGNHRYGARDVRTRGDGMDLIVRDRKRSVMRWENT